MLLIDKKYKVRERERERKKVSEREGYTEKEQLILRPCCFCSSCCCCCCFFVFYEMKKTIKLVKKKIRQKI
jgi:hypothetical protein